MGKTEFALIIMLIAIILFPALPTTHGNNSLSTQPFTCTRSATFVAHGLPSSDNFSVQILGKYYFSIGGNLTISGLSPILYNYTIKVPSTLSANISSGSVNLTSGNALVNFQVHGASVKLNYLILVSILVTVFALIVVSALLFRKERK